MHTTTYLAFLESLSTPEHAPLIEAAKAGFKTLFEAPHGFTTDGRDVDLHVEDVLKKNGPTIALQYVRELIQKIKDNKSLDIPLPGVGEVSHVDNPRDVFSNASLEDILFRLGLIERGLASTGIKSVLSK